MAWYWWVLIGIALIGLIILKAKVSSAWMRKRKQQREAREKLMEENE